MNDWMKKKNPTAREIKLDELIRDIAELCFDDDETLEKAVKRAEELAAEKTPNGEKNKEAWAHTIGYIGKTVMEEFNLVKEEKIDRVAMAKAIAAKKRAKKSKKVEA